MALYMKTLPRREVRDAKDNLLAEVRGLSFNDLNKLVAKNYDNLDKLLSVWEHYQEISQRQDPGAIMTDTDFAAFIADVCQACPAIMADIILMAADEDEDEDAHNKHSMIMKWPMHAQCRALGTIYGLSVEDFGGPVKLVGALIQQIRTAAPALGMTQE